MGLLGTLAITVAREGEQCSFQGLNGQERLLRRSVVRESDAHQLGKPNYYSCEGQSVERFESWIGRGFRRLGGGEYLWWWRCVEQRWLWGNGAVTGASDPSYVTCIEYLAPRYARDCVSVVFGPAVAIVAAINGAGSIAASCWPLLVVLGAIAGSRVSRLRLGLGLKWSCRIDWDWVD